MVKQVRVTKTLMEKMCAAAHMKPISRSNLSGYEVFVADGFSVIPAIKYAKFGVVHGEFPRGAFCTLWFAVKSEDKVLVGQPLIFAHNHDMDLGIPAVRETARVNAALKHAKAFMELAKRHSKKGRVLDA